MSFAEQSFAVFLTAFVLIYLSVPRRASFQNIVIIIGSIIFYGWWDWRFVLLLAFSCYFNWEAGRAIARWRPAAGRILFASVFVDLAIIFAFKYFNFFSSSFAEALRYLGFSSDSIAINVILPLGISFYTFQAVGYLVDIHRGRAEAEQNFLTFCCFKIYFPQLIAGPIERADNLLIQFRSPRAPVAEDIQRGIGMVVWGYFLKLVVADNLAGFVEVSFQHGQVFAWSTVLGTAAFGLQIFGDFAGYSLIARGISKILGINLIDNFLQPYCSADIQEFWRRWHVSLSSWIRDYVYIPLGGSRHGVIRNVVILYAAMGLCGLWHGAGWNFVAWGVFHASCLAGFRVWRHFAGERVVLPRAIARIMTLSVVMCGWLLFRVSDWTEARDMVTALGNWDWLPGHGALLAALVGLGAPVALVETVIYRRGAVPSLGGNADAVVVGCLVVAIWALGNFNRPAFIYFQF